MSVVGLSLRNTWSILSHGLTLDDLEHMTYTLTSPQLAAELLHVIWCYIGLKSFAGIALRDSAECY